MFFSLAEKVCVITGGTSGIGRAVAKRFAASGAHVAIVGRRATAELARELNAALFIRADCSTEAGVEEAMQTTFDKLGPLDVIVNNAGLENTGPFIADATDEELHRVFALNTFGVFYGLKHGQKHARDGASIINTSSLAALTALPGYGQYSASKAAVVSLTQTAAIELAPRLIRVNAVCPGSVYTEMMPEGHPEAKMAALVAPLRRVGTTDDMVGLYHFLAASESAYLTGQAIAIDGGISAGIGLGVLEAIAR